VENRQSKGGRHGFLRPPKLRKHFLANGLLRFV
jgi:hypothetical protein